MRNLTLALLAASALVGCAGRDTTAPYGPTYSPARPTPGLPAPVAPPAEPVKRTMEPISGPRVTGARAIVQSMRGSAIEPDSSSLVAGTWNVSDVQTVRPYRLYLKPGWTTTILLPEGEQFQPPGAVGGQAERFNTTMAYAGSRPLFSISPKDGTAGGNIQILTNQDLYPFEVVVTKSTALSVVNLQRSRPLPPATRTRAPQPVGDYTPLSFQPLDGPLPAYMQGASAFADSQKLVIAFPAEPPTLPTLLIGGQGEQITNYQVVRDRTGVFIVTDRRVTEAMLVDGPQRVRITVSPGAVQQGITTDPALGADGWKQAGDLPPTGPFGSQPVTLNLGVVVAPSASPGQEVFGFAPKQAEPKPQPVETPAKPAPADDLVRL